MGEFAKWLPQVSWTDLAVGIVAGPAILGALVLLAYFLLPHRRKDETGYSREREEKARRRLLCEDAKVLADLAIQRHMSDVAFLERLRAQPCYDALYSHFSDGFRERLTQPNKHPGRSDMAAACREECERLEQKWRAG